MFDIIQSGNHFCACQFGETADHILATHKTLGAAQDYSRRVESKVRAAIDSCADLIGCAATEFDGWTIENLFNDIERGYPHAVIYWGCWSTAELAIRINAADLVDNSETTELILE